MVEVKEKELKHTKNPKWIRVKLPTGKKYTELRGLVENYKLNTKKRQMKQLFSLFLK